MESSLVPSSNQLVQQEELSVGTVLDLREEEHAAELIRIYYFTYLYSRHTC